LCSLFNVFVNVSLNFSRQEADVEKVESSRETRSASESTGGDEGSETGGRMLEATVSITM